MRQHLPPIPLFLSDWNIAWFLHSVANGIRLTVIGRKSMPLYPVTPLMIVIKSMPGQENSASIIGHSGVAFVSHCEINSFSVRSIFRKSLIFFCTSDKWSAVACRTCSQVLSALLAKLSNPWISFKVNPSSRQRRIKISCLTCSSLYIRWPPWLLAGVPSNPLVS